MLFESSRAVLDRLPQTKSLVPIRAHLTANALYVSLAFLVLLIPCFWLPRIHAGDLSSHIYNAWLAGEVRGGRAPGLQLADQWTNSLFDLILSFLLPRVGLDWTQRFAVSASVLIFAGGLFAWIRQQTRHSWCILPLLFVLSYGRMFHVGLFNFYLALGLALCALATARARAWWKVLALIIMGLSFVAHVLGAALVTVLAATLFLLRRTRPRRRIYSTLSFITLICIGRLALPYILPIEWPFFNLDFVGASHFVVYGPEFRGITTALMCILLIAIAFEFVDYGWRRLLADPWIHVLVLCCVASALVPWGLRLPEYRYTLGFLDLRVSFGVILTLLILAARSRYRRTLFTASCVVALIFFSCLYARLRSIDAVENRMEAAASRLTPHSRVVSSLRAGYLVDPFLHMVDRVCIARCYSYANYEPPSNQFRIRALGPSPVVQWDPKKNTAMGSGQYVVEAADVPLWQLRAEDLTTLEIHARPLLVGETLQIQNVPSYSSTKRLVTNPAFKLEGDR